MEYYTVPEKIQIVKWYYQGKPLRNIIALFSGVFQNRAKPSLVTVSRVIKNFENCGCVSPRNHKNKPVVDEKRELKHVMICATVNENPKLTINQVAEAVGTSIATVKRVLKKNGIRTCKSKKLNEISNDTVGQTEVTQTIKDKDTGDHLFIGHTIFD